MSKFNHYIFHLKNTLANKTSGILHMKILITGANTGIGFATAEELVKQGQHVILACRNPQKAQIAQDKLRALGQGQVDLVSLDLNSLQSTRNTADEIADRYGSLDVLINNAGLFAKTKQLAPGAAEQLSFTIPASILASFDEASNQWIVEPGSYSAYISPSSDVSATTPVTFTLQPFEVATLRMSAAG